MNLIRGYQEYKQFSLPLIEEMREYKNGLQGREYTVMTRFIQDFILATQDVRCPIERWFLGTYYDEFNYATRPELRVFMKKALKMVKNSAKIRERCPKLSDIEEQIDNLEPEKGKKEPARNWVPEVKALRDRERLRKVEDKRRIP